jgi:hypothetical protein
MTQPDHKHCYTMRLGPETGISIFYHNDGNEPITMHTDWGTKVTIPPGEVWQVSWQPIPPTWHWTSAPHEPDAVKLDQRDFDGS